MSNKSKKKVLETENGDKVIQKVLDLGKPNQLWKRGELDDEGYFTLQNCGEPKFLTAISESSMEIQGNITMR